MIKVKRMKIANNESAFIQINTSYFSFSLFRKGVIHHYLDINLSFSKTNTSFCIMCIDALLFFFFSINAGCVLPLRHSL